MLYSHWSLDHRLNSLLEVFEVAAHTHCVPHRHLGIQNLRLSLLNRHSIHTLHANVQWLLSYVAPPQLLIRCLVKETTIGTRLTSSYITIAILFLLFFLDSQHAVQLLS